VTIAKRPCCRGGTGRVGKDDLPDDLGVGKLNENIRSTHAWTLNDVKLTGGNLNLYDFERNVYLSLPRFDFSATK
jgi:hypothetical protein